jgi:hypothetical protein
VPFYASLEPLEDVVELLALGFEIALIVPIGLNLNRNTL